MKFNPEDGQLTGPRCRNCHKGSSGCGACHNTDHAFPVLGNNANPLGDNTNAAKNALVTNNGRQAITFLFAAMFNYVDTDGMSYGFPTDSAKDGTGSLYGSDEPNSIMNFAPITAYETTHTSNGLLNEVQNAHLTTGATTINGNATIVDQIKKSRTVGWTSSTSVSWRDSTGTVAGGTIINSCSDDGLSFPHRTLGWKMLKDDLFGIDPGQTEVIDGQTVTKFVKAGAERQGAYAIVGVKAHDVDSVCLDCHNPTVWNATSTSTHTDTAASNDNANDDLLLRGLP